MAKVVKWADGTNKEIQAMVDAAYAGEIDLADYWHVGDCRIIDGKHFVIKDFNGTYCGEKYKVLCKLEEEIVSHNKNMSKGQRWRYMLGDTEGKKLDNAIANIFGTV